MIVAVVVLIATGCSPLSAVHWGVKLAGDAVEHEQMHKMGEPLIGKTPADADAMFGDRTDALKDVKSDRVWLVYPAKGDLLKSHRYVVEVARGKIVAVSETHKNANPKIDIPETLILRGKVVGKSPDECEAELGSKRLLLTVRSKVSGLLEQMYDSTLIKIKIAGLTKPHYCQLRFDKQDLCAHVVMLEEDVTTKRAASR